MVHNVSLFSVVQLHDNPLSILFQCAENALANVLAAYPSILLVEEDRVHPPL